MNLLSDQFSQFSAVRKTQFDAQFDFFNSMTTHALESAGRLAALNLAVSRDSVQRSLGASFALMNSRDPRDVLSLGGQAEEQMRSLFAYGRELLGIAGGMRPYAPRPAALAQAQASRLLIDTVDVVERSVADLVADTAPALAAPLEAAAATDSALESVAEPSSDAASAADPAAAILAAIAPADEPVVVAEPAPAPELLAAAEPVPVAEPKAIAKAAGKGTARAGAVPHPAAAPVAASATDEGAAPKIVMPQGAPKRKK
ncbi:phasin family protein [Massilia sp. X63]|uniref:phasin family protein n=1 Tax=Massilia sp. X63 TaxID=3237285 RepID=UPI0034DD756F